MNDIVDMAQFVEAKSDQLNADDLIGAPRTITVRKVTGSEGDQPVSIFYNGDNNKPFKPCKTMRRILLAIWGRNAADYIGRSMTLYRDDKVTFGGLDVGGIRISHMSHIDKETVVVVAKTKGKKAGVKIQPLAVDDPAAKWAADFIGKVAAVTSLDELRALETTNAKSVAKLKDTRPELHTQIAKSIANIADGFVSQEQDGEQTSLTDALDAIAKATDATAVNTIVSGNLDGLADADRDALLAAGNDRIAEMEADD